MIGVKQSAEGDPSTFVVTVDDGRGTSRHTVTLTTRDRERYFGAATPEEGIEAAFRFLLDREPKESILRTFDVAVIARYFPEFGDRIGDYLGGVR